MDANPHDFDTRVKLAIYRHFADAARRPDVSEIARAVESSPTDVSAAYGRLFKSRVLVLEADGTAIRMAPPFSGVPTQHRVVAGDREYFANCAWDSLGILAALHSPGTVHSSCGQSNEAVAFEISAEGPPQTEWVFHCAVPAAQWWKDIVFT